MISNACSGNGGASTIADASVGARFVYAHGSLLYAVLSALRVATVDTMSVAMKVVVAAMVVAVGALVGAIVHSQSNRIFYDAQQCR